MLQKKALDTISVSDICKEAGLNRSTFYANFRDIYDLADRLRSEMEKNFSNVFADHDYFNDRSGALKMFTHIKDNQIFYSTYFKLCYDDAQKISPYDPLRAEKDKAADNIDYHIEFFRAGLNAIIKKWLNSGCKESPEEMALVLKSEYRGR